MQIDTDDYPDYQSDSRQGVDVFTLVAVVFILFIAFNLLHGHSTSATAAVEADPASFENPQAAPAPPQVEDPSAIAPPYDKFVLTQGPHGASYGQMAIDIVAGKGATIKSPISGVVTNKFVDQYGNPTLIIENDVYRITLLHGNYTVAVGEHVVLGQPVGRESNKGLTTDMQGRSCKGRNCGYHTHINIFDKRLGRNVNPLVVLGVK